MAKRIKMLTTYASPIMVLHEGCCYSVPDALAEELLAAGAGQSEGETAAKPAPKTAKLKKAQMPPDPGEQKPLEEEEDLEDDEDDELDEIK